MCMYDDIVYKTVIKIHHIFGNIINLEMDGNTLNQFQQSLQEEKQTETSASETNGTFCVHMHLLILCH